MAKEVSFPMAKEDFLNTCMEVQIFKIVLTFEKFWKTAARKQRRLALLLSN